LYEILINESKRSVWGARWDIRNSRSVHESRKPNQAAGTLNPMAILNEPTTPIISKMSTEEPVEEPEPEDHDLYRLWALQEEKHLKEKELRAIDQEIAELNAKLGPGYEPSSPAYGPCDVFDYPAEVHENGWMPTDN